MQRQFLTIAFGLTALLVVAVSAAAQSEDDDEMITAASEEVAAGELDASATEYGHHYSYPKHHYKEKLGYISKHADHGHEAYEHNTHDSYIPKKVVSYGYGGRKSS